MKSLNDKQKQGEEMRRELRKSRGGGSEDSEEEGNEEWLWQNSEKEEEPWKKEGTTKRGRVLKTAGKNISCKMIQI